MSGQENYDAKLEQFDSILDEYRTGLGLDNIQSSSDAIKYLSIDYNQLQGMEDEECGYASLSLSQFAAFIQMESNRHSARIDWAEKELRKIIAKNGKNYGDKYTKYEMLREMVIAGNTAANKLNDIISEAKSRTTELNTVADKIVFISRRFDNIISVRHKRRC